MRRLVAGRRSGWERWRACLLCLVVALLAGCGNSTANGPAPVGSGKFGSPCQRSEDCQSGVCVRLDSRGGICSIACTEYSSCPQADNWACVQTLNVDFRVCACRQLASVETCADGLDNDCDGAVDDCRVCDGVQVANDDHAHCGRCDNACRGDQDCVDGACQCPGELSECAGRCVDLMTDTNACGACGVDCGGERICAAGRCECPANDESYCAGLGCVDLKRDENACGACGTSCDFARECAGGECVCPSTAAPDFCPKLGCVNLAQDSANCGACGKSCRDDQVCTNGTCECAGGKRDCDGTCTDVGTDVANCGECGAACGAEQACIAGSCACNTGGYGICAGACVNVHTDPLHCGSCDKECAEGERCANGCVCDSGLYCDQRCVPANDDANCGECGHACTGAQHCDAGECVCNGFGLSVCGAACVDTESDEANCGECEATCQGGELCVAGSCACPAGEQYCAAAGKCVNLKSDTKHCGQCGNACDPTEVCASGVCGCAAAGALYCASETSCVDTKANPKHCGSCDKACNPTQLCVGGQCNCPQAGQLYCASHNACTDTLSNARDCGACDKACNPTEICETGACKCAGATEKYCAASKACVNLVTDAKNCGACDVKCPNATHCASSACACNVAGQTICSGVCFDLQTDVKHCGDCANACTGAYQCKAGACKCDSPTLGTEVQVNPDAFAQTRFTAAFDGTHIGVAYLRTEVLNSHYELYFALLNTDGTLFKVQAVTSYPANALGVIVAAPHLVWTGSEYGLAWTQNLTSYSAGQVMLRRLKADGSYIGPAQIVADTVVTQGTNNYAAGNALAWNGQYGGYGVVFTRTAGTTHRVTFRRVGADGTGTDPEYGLVADGWNQEGLKLGAAADGSWMIGTTYAELSLRTATGAASGPLQELAGGANNANISALIQDGQGWLTTFVQNGGDAYVNRGSVVNSPSVVYSTNGSRQQVRLVPALVNGTIALLDSSLANGAGVDKLRLSLQRFALPADASSKLRAIDDSIIVNPSESAASDRNTSALVTTGPKSLLAIWSDARTSPSQLYARPIQLPACP